jgi:hypothetical protein
MSIEQQLRSSIDSLDLELPPGLAARAVRGGRRRQYRRRTAASSVGLLGIAAAGGAVAATQPDGGHGTVNYAADTRAYVQNGVSFDVPRDLPLVVSSDRGMSFDDGDSIITVLVTRYEIDPSFAHSPIMKDLGNHVLFRVSGTDQPTMQAIAASAADSFDGTAVTVQGLRVPVPEGFGVSRVTGPDTGTGIVEARGTIRLCRPGRGPADPHADGCLTVVLNQYPKGALVDFDAGGTSVDADGVVTGHEGRVADDGRTTAVQVTAYGIERSVVEQLLRDTAYA